MSNYPMLRGGRLAVLAIAVWCAACYGGASLAATRSGIVMQPQVGGPFVYGCASEGGFCNVYGAKGNLLRTVSNGLLGPMGIATDSAGRWYVANSKMSNVLVFAGGRTAPVRTIADAGQAPGDVAAGRNEVAVSNIAGLPSGPASVSVYRHGATSPSEVLHYAAAAQGVSIAYDFYGNCYWSFSAGTAGGGIVEFPKCSANKAPVELKLAIASPGGIAFDRKHDLWYVDQTAGLFECRGVKSCVLVASGFVDPFLIKFDEHGDDLYLMDTAYGIYKISGITGRGPLRSRLMLSATPFAAISPSAFPAGVAAGSASEPARRKTRRGRFRDNTRRRPPSRCRP